MRGHRGESVQVHPEHKGAAIAVLDKHACVDAPRGHERLIYRANLALWTEQSRATTNG